MRRPFKRGDYDRALDLTVRLGDYLLPDHLARFVVDSVGSTKNWVPRLEKRATYRCFTKKRG